MILEWDMTINAGLLDDYARRIVTPFHDAAERHGTPVPHSFVLRSDSVTYGIGYASQVLEQDDRTDLAWRALIDAADESEQQLTECGWLFTADEQQELRVTIREIRQFIVESAPSAVWKEAAAPV